MTILDTKIVRTLSPASDSDDVDDGEHQGNPKIHENDKIRDACRGKRQEAGDGLKSNTCLVCDGIDNWVLVCHGEECPLAIHQSCISDELDFDEFGKFYCPYCWYKLVVVKSVKLQNKLMVTENSRKEGGVDQADYVAEDVLEVNVSGGRTSTSVNPSGNIREGDECISMEKNQQMKEVGKVSKTDDADVYQGRQHRGRLCEKNHETFDACISNGQENGFRKDKQVEGNPLSSISYPMSRDNVNDSNGVSQELALIIHPKVGVQERPIEAQAYCSVPSFRPEEYRHRSYLEKNGTASTDPGQRKFVLCNERKRKRIIWTQAEEEMLKVGVQRFPGVRNIPWRKILEFGRDVFQEERVPSDLKDKWKNMNKMSLDTGKWVSLYTERQPISICPDVNFE